MAAQKLRIGFCGTGNMGQCAHLRNYAALKDECDVVALAEIRRETGAAVARKYGVPAVYTEAKDMLKNEKLDAIVASQPFTRHGVIMPELLEAGIPVFTEKPLSGSIACGERIIAAMRKAKTWMMIGYHKRSDPASMYALERVKAFKASGELGKLTYIRVTMPAGDWVQNGFFDHLNCEGSGVTWGGGTGLQWEPAPDDMPEDLVNPYHAFVNYYIHQVNFLRYLLGEGYHFKYADPSGVLVAGESDSGVALTLEMTPYRTTRDWQESALIAFQHGWISVELPAPLALNRAGTVTVFRDPEKSAEGPSLTTPVLPNVHAMRQQAANFLAAVRGERAPMCTAEDALLDLHTAREYIRLRYGR